MQLPTGQELRQFCTIKLGLKPNSVRHVLSRYGIFITWLETNNQTITPLTVEAFLYELKERGLKNNSINTYIGMLYQLDKFLIDRGIDGGGFTQTISSLPKNSTTIIPLSFDEAQRLLGTTIEYGEFRGMDCSRLNDVYLCLIELMLTTGCRYSEATNLTYEYLDVDNMTVTFADTKNGDWRVGYITKSLAEKMCSLGDRAKLKSLIFTTMNGNVIPPQNFSPDLKARAVKANITKKINPHLFRHTCASWWHSAGVSLRTIQELLGHKDISSTQKYLHLSTDHMRIQASTNPLIMQQADRRVIVDNLVKINDAYAHVLDKRFTYTKSQTDSRLTITIDY